MAKFHQLCTIFILLTTKTMATDTVALATEFPLETCTVETHACQCPEAGAVTSFNATATADTNGVTSLNFMIWDQNCLRVSLHIPEFEQRTGIKVNVDCFKAPTGLGEYFQEIVSDAKLQTGLYDGYALGPHLFGDLDLVEGLYDLSPLVRSGTIGNMAGYDFAWNDMFLFYRENGAVYDKKIVGIPIDGDVHTLHYRTDLFDKYNKVPPATWEEYTELAKFFHGKEELIPGTNMTVPITGNCVGNAYIEYWVFLIMSSMTQYEGTPSGAFFDTRNGKNMEPLLGEAFVKTLQYMEEQMIYSTDGSLEANFIDINMKEFTQGRCAMTYMWGDLFKEASKSPPTSYVAEYVGTAFTPGSLKVLNRDTQKLESCTEDLCSCGNPFFPGKESDSCINSAPYAAYTGWTASCANVKSSAQKEACAEFWGYISSPDTSVQDTIPNLEPGAAYISVDPYRKSQTQLEDWVERGLRENTTREFLDTIKKQLEDTNVVLDMRIPATSSFQQATNEALKRHLKKVQERMDSGIKGDDLLSTEEERWQTERELRAVWRQVITDYDKIQPRPLLEAYQRNLGIYNPDDSATNSMGAGPILAIVAGIIALSAAAVLLIVREKNKKNDAVWQIEAKEIKYEDPPIIAGRGRFGMVLVGEYRGTEVAVKRVLPRKKQAVGGKASSVGTASMAGWVSDDIEAPGPTEQPSMFSTANVSDLMSNKIGESNSMPGSGDGMTASSAKSGDTDAIRKQLKKDFVKEMRLLSKLRHPCITTVIGAVMNNKEDPMLVMEYMNHGSLHDILHNETMILEGSMLLQILRDISQGVRFLHSFDPKIIHCDLKANNILVDSRWRAKVADFGLSIQDRSTASGTPYWMAPELLRKEASNTAASDVYAFGIILYEVFSRKDPYEGEDPVEVLKLVCDENVNKRPPMPSGCPPQIDSIMKDCLVADPEGRPTFEELDMRLKRVEAKEVETQQEKLSVSLFDIFPKHIAEALKAGRPVKPEHKEVVTIFFSDIVGFTDLSAVLEPHKVANMLGRLYDKLDALSNQHEVFKVETIGDAYMAVTNLVKDQSEDHVKRIAEFAADAIAAANSTLVDLEDTDKGYLNIRVGFHSGPVVADVVGSLNPRYCLFGDTVNTSSRMESNSVANRIHCSEASAKLLKKQNPGMKVMSRGMINVKGKGLMQTFWVNDKASGKVNDKVSDKVQFQVIDEVNDEVNVDGRVEISV